MAQVKIQTTLPHFCNHQILGHRTMFLLNECEALQEFTFVVLKCYSPSELRTQSSSAHHSPHPHLITLWGRLGRGIVMGTMSPVGFHWQRGNWALPGSSALNCWCCAGSQITTDAGDGLTGHPKNGLCGVRLHSCIFQSSQDCFHYLSHIYSALSPKKLRLVEMVLVPSA